MEQGLLEGFGHLKTETNDDVNFDLSISEQGVLCSCICVVHKFGCNTISTRGRRHKSPNCFCKKEVVYSIEELYHYRMRRIGNGIFTAKFSTLFIGFSL